MRILRAGLPCLLGLSLSAWAGPRWADQSLSVLFAAPSGVAGDRQELWKYLKYPIDPSFLEGKLKEFSGAAPTEIDGEQVLIPERASLGGRELARKFLEREYAALGFKVRRQEYEISGYQGVNVLAERPGTKPGVLILSSHFDSMGNAGANDDGSGTVALIAVAKALAGAQLTHTLRIVAFDQEEPDYGMFGSRAYAESLSHLERKLVIGDIQLEMMAYNGRNDGGFHAIDCDRPESRPLAQHLMNAVSALELPLKQVPACTDQSDHGSFWYAGMPAIVISDNFFGGDRDPCFHRGCDVVDGRLNFAFSARIAEAVASAAAELLGVREQVTRPR
jgi:hypothetical protein